MKKNVLIILVIFFNLNIQAQYFNFLSKYERLDSIKFFKDYLDLVENQGLTAEQSIREINEELENLLTENLEE